MTNKLMKFESPDLNVSLSGMLYHGKPVFDAVALAKSLGYANPSDALQKHCKSLIKLNYSESRELEFGDNPRGMQLAGQADMFRLILRSQLPSAERVQDWVCEEVLPSIMTTGSYGNQRVPDRPVQQNVSMNNDILSLARVVAEATASATMKAVMEVSGMNLIAPQPLAMPEPVALVCESPVVFDGFVLVSELSMTSGLSDSTCRRLATFASLPTRLTNGGRGHLLINRESFMEAAQVLLDESTPPAGKRKRWQHPEFGGFELRIKSETKSKGDEE